MRTWLPTLLLSVLSALPISILAQTPSPRVLLIVSSEGRDQGKTRPGFEMDEYALAWHVFAANGLRIEVASPAGGAVQADRFNPQDDAIAALPPAAHEALQLTRRTAELGAETFDAVFVVGGKGAMFDLPRDPALARLLAAQAQAQRVLAAVCHGPAALASVVVDGKPLVQGRRVTGFTDEEEAVFGKRWAKEFPFWLEAKLREQGARWEEAALMMPKVVVDGRLVTAQNPFATAQAAEEVVRLLGRTPVARTPFREEASMRLAERWLAATGSEREAVRRTLREALPQHKPELLAMLGHYQFQSAQDDTTRRQALSLMEFAAPHFDHPMLRLSLAEAHAALGHQVTARTLLAALQAEKLDEATRGKVALAVQKLAP